jgi:riboflavin biosynthesis pyrimidine reductase
MIETIFDCSGEKEPAFLPERLRVVYGGDLSFPAAPSARPYVVANFVSTLDGVVSFSIPGESGGETISLANPGDRFIMGLLRASADAVVVGSGTVAAVDPTALWLAEYVYPQAADLYTQYRQVLGKPMHPLTVIVSGTGRLDLSRAIFHTAGAAVLVLTTEPGRGSLLAAGAGALATVTIRALPEQDGRLASSAILGLLQQEFGARLVLHEGGPTLFGQFLADRLLDELCLTLAPQIAGRVAAHPRPGLVQNWEFIPRTAPWLHLLSVKRGGDHLYLRYRLRPSEQQ